MKINWIGAEFQIVFEVYFLIWIVVKIYIVYLYIPVKPFCSPRWTSSCPRFFPNGSPCATHEAYRKPKSCKFCSFLPIFPMLSLVQHHHHHSSCIGERDNTTHTHWKILRLQTGQSNPINPQLEKLCKISNGVQIISCPVKGYQIKNESTLRCLLVFGQEVSNIGWTGFFKPFAFSHKILDFKWL